MAATALYVSSPLTSGNKPARFRAVSLKQPRQHSIAVRAAKGDSIFSKGTQFFKLGRQEEEGEEEEEQPRSGTQFFTGWGKKEKEQEEEDEEEEEKPAFFGTQRLRFGTRSGNGAATIKGGALVRKEANTALDALPFGRGRRTDPRTVFVAGATGQIGARISQQLLHAGFNIRGGVRDIYFAQQLAEFASQYGVRSLTSFTMLSISYNSLLSDPPFSFDNRLI